MVISEQAAADIARKALYQKAMNRIEQNPDRCGALSLEEAKEYGFDPEEYKHEPEELKQDFWAEAETSWLAEDKVRR